MPDRFLLILFVSLTCSITDVQAQSVLWKVEKNGEKTSYLLGTLHIRQAPFLNYSDSVYAAIAASDMFYGELESLKSILYEQQSPAYKDYVRERSLYMDSLWKTENWRKYIKKLNALDSINLDPDSSSQYFIYLQEKKTKLFTDDPAIPFPDALLQGFAIQLGKPTGGLETYLSQVQMSSLMLEQNIQDQSIQSFQEEKNFSNALAHYYLNERLDSIDLIYNQLSTKQRDLLLNDRNIGMADSMQQLMKQKSIFFAVGVAHLPGEKGLISLLEAAGYTVTPVLSSNKISLKLLFDLNKKAIREKEKQEKQGN